MIRSFPAARGNQPAAVPFREPRYPSHSPASLSLRWTVGAERHASLHLSVYTKPTKPCSSGGFFVLPYIFLMPIRIFFISSFLSCTAFFCVIATFFLSSSKNMFELKELPLYAGALQRESSFAHLSVSFIQFSLKARGNPSRSFRLTRGRSRQTGRRTPGRTSAGAQDRRASSRICRSNRPARPRAASRRIPSRICRC